MAKKAYFGVDGKARKIKKWYYGVDGKARKIKKGYIGVGGIARPFVGGDELAYYGTIDALSDPRNGKSVSSHAGASNANYAVFVGGYRGTNSFSNIAEAYSVGLVRSSPESLSVGRRSLDGARAGDYVVFAGGEDASAESSVADAYNNNVVRSTAPAISSARYNLAATSVGGQALFAGGRRKDSSSYKYLNVDVYDANLKRTRAGDLPTGDSYIDGVANDEYALFVLDKYVYSYSKTLVQKTLSAMESDIMCSNNTAYNGTYFVIAGFTNTALVQAYSSTLVKTTAPALANARDMICAAGLGKYALIAGGTDEAGDSDVLSSVEVYNEKLVRSSTHDLAAPAEGAVSATLGDYVLFAGGTGTTSKIRGGTVDVYTLV